MSKSKTKHTEPELEQQKLVQEIKALKKSNKSSQVVLFITLLVSVAGVGLPFLTEEKKMTHEEIKLFQELSKDYYDLVEQDPTGFLEEKFVLTSRMIMLIDKKKEDEVLYRHINEIYEKAKIDFNEAKAKIAHLDTKRAKVKREAVVVVDSNKEEAEQELKAIKEVYEEIAPLKAQSHTEKKQRLARKIDELQQKIVLSPPIVVDTLIESEDSTLSIEPNAVDSTSFFTIQSLEINKKLYQRPRQKENILLDRIHWFKEGYYVALPLDTVEFAVWLDKLDRTHETIEVSCWKRNPTTELLERIPNSKKIISKKQHVNWKIDRYKIDFQFLELERAGVTKSKAAYFDVKVKSIPKVL